MSDQQNQTKQHFVTHAEGWQAKAEQTTRGDGVIEGRKNAVLSVLKSFEKVDSFLDVACGTGQLVLAVADQGISSLGVDFSEKMIEICESNRKGRDALGMARFQSCSFFDMPTDEQKFDVISAQGFIEYISIEQLNEFFSRSAKMLRKGGALVVGSRNRLFNTFSQNAFTQMEMDLGVLNDLMSESIAFQSSSSIDEAIKKISPFEQTLEHPERHPDTQVGVETRYQYSPAELIYILRKHGFTPNCIYPINFHGLSPALKKDFPEVQRKLSSTMSSLAPTDPRLIPQSSTFVLDMRKT